MTQRPTEPWDDPYGEDSAANRTMPLDGDATEVLDDRGARGLDEDRTEVLDGGRTEVLDDRTDILSAADQRTQVLDHGSWGSATQDSNATRPLPSYGEGSSAPSAQKRSGLEYDEETDRTGGPRSFRPTSPEDAPGASTGRPGYANGPAGQAAAPSGPDLRGMVIRRQKAEYGRLQLLPGLLGWLVATALVGFLTWALGVLAPIAGASGLPTHLGNSVRDLADGSGHGALWCGVFGVVFFVSYVVGGYAAGRAGRFSGAKQGVAVWLWQLMGTAVTTVLTLFFADRMGESVPLGSVQSLGGPSFVWGLVAAVCVLVIGLLGAILGGLWGTRFHRSVDRWGFEGR
ncbi:hypothetical protein GMA10_08280 [Kocuria koreensis]|jgi:hypothetical protein|uniref:Uncharacterized protein n=1 Tax=Rothia koreensis TaxID=592378 RepID=A0A7K1LJ33_9MICC|nr:hypothetical protein [Rothia koreensis]MUN55207.1 hypothetical protein [Rothia koreensis]